MQSEQYSQRALQPLQLCNRTDGMTTVFLSPFPRGILFTTWHSSKFQICRLGSHRNFACVKTPLFKSFQNDQIWPILQQKTIPIVFELDPLFLIRAKINIETGRTEQATEKKKSKKHSTDWSEFTAGLWVGASEAFLSELVIGATHIETQRPARWRHCDPIGCRIFLIFLLSWRRVMW